MPTDLPEKGRVRPDVVEAIQRAFPSGIVDLPDDLEDTWFTEVYPKLKTKLAKVSGASLMFEKEADGFPADGPEWKGDVDPEEDPEIFEKLADLDWGEISSSYHLFFLALTGSQFQFESEDLRHDEDGEVVGTVEGTGRIGCAVGVSLIAPYAIIALNSIEDFEDGERFEPEIDLGAFELDGTPRNPDEHFREMFLDEGVEALHALHDRITPVLESFGIEVLTDEVLEQPVPGLRAGLNTVVKRGFMEEFKGEPLTVKDALFFWGA